MSVEEIKALARRFLEESNKGKAAFMAALDKGYATDVVFHSPTGRDIRGLKDLKQYENELYSAFPYIHLTIDDIFVEGDKVACRWTFTGTHKGEWRGIPPTNEKVTMWAINIFHIVGGKIVEEWSRWDTLGAMRQLGLVPTPKGK